MTKESEFDQLFRTYFQRLYLFVHQYVSSEEECRDIVSATYEDVWRNYDSVDPTSVKAYLYRTARNRMIDFLRKEDKRQRYVAYATAMSQRYIHEDRLAEQEHSEHIVAQLLRQMGEPTGSILAACYIEGKKYKEVAEEMNMSVANVKKHMVRALRAVREVKKNIKS